MTANAKPLTLRNTCVIAVITLLAIIGSVSYSGSAKAPDARLSENQIDSRESTPSAEFLRTVAWQDPGPFGKRVAAPEFPEGVDWLNTRTPLRMADCRGKFVLLDFWTYCCINCMHILPVLDQAEQKYANQLIVIGVHSAKFETEQDTDNIREAMLRYDIHHPVFNDSKLALWNKLAVNTWPTLVLVDPEGYAIWGHSGEIAYEELEAVLEKAVAYYRPKKVMDERPVRFEIIQPEDQNSPLRFPGKVIADQDRNRLFIADSNHNRIVVTDLQGNLQTIIGSGEAGRQDGDFSSATLKKPQGMAILGDKLFIADTENHLIRRADLSRETVETIAGTGKQTRNPWSGISEGGNIRKNMTLDPLGTDLGSPWDLWTDGSNIWIAMAGPHQIWRMDSEAKTLIIQAGNGREDIVDGALLPTKPYGLGSSSFAQPSGLGSDGTLLFVADSEGSSIRSLPLQDSGPVRTILGTAKLREKRLFTFGDRDGSRADALLQHPLGVAYVARKLIIADTYNNKIKSLELSTGMTRTIAGDGQAGNSDAPPRFNEPGGLFAVDNTIFIADTNNHLIRKLDLDSRTVSTLKINGLQPPRRKDSGLTLEFPDGVKRISLAGVTVPNDSLRIPARLKLNFPPGWKLNLDAPLRLVVRNKSSATATSSPTGVTQQSGGNVIPIPTPQSELKFDIAIEETNQQAIEVIVQFYFCQIDGKGLCLADAVIFEIAVQRGDDGKTNEIELIHEAQIGAIEK